MTAAKLRFRVKACKRYGITIFAVLIGAALYLGLPSGRPPATDYPRTATYAISPGTPGPLQRAAAHAAAAHAPLSGFRLIAQGDEALMIRIGMIQAASHTLDMQYYSFQNDDSGKLILEAVLRAADRGVRVRMLIDDLTLKKADPTWALLHAHPHIEIRLFNPFATYDQSYLSRALHVVSGFAHFTKRMHNKAFIVDNQLSVLGGRNLADSYFDYSQDFNFRDIDILSIGGITAHISSNFDSFWNGKEAYPLDVLQYKAVNADSMALLRRALKNKWRAAAENGALARLPSLIEQIDRDAMGFTWAPAELMADSPAKVDTSAAQASSKPLAHMRGLADTARSELIIVSPYFVPGDERMAWLKALHARGVKVRVLTNSLGSTDVVAVHAGYRHYRKRLLENGAELYEMKPLSGSHRKTGRFASSSRASLHTKIYIIDRRDIVAGTMNLDPRSDQLNTEAALVIHSPELAQRMAGMFEQAAAPASSYHVTLGDSHLEWLTEENGREVHYEREPRAGFKRMAEVDLYALLPFENQL